MAKEKQEIEKLAEEIKWHKQMETDYAFAEYLHMLGYRLPSTTDVDTSQVVGMGGEVDDSNLTSEESAAAVRAIIKPSTAKDEVLLTDEDIIFIHEITKRCCSAPWGTVHAEVEYTALHFKSLGKAKPSTANRKEVEEKCPKCGGSTYSPDGSLQIIGGYYTPDKSAVYVQCGSCLESVETNLLKFTHKEGITSLSLISPPMEVLSKEIDIPDCVFMSKEAKSVGFTKRSFLEAGWRKVSQATIDKNRLKEGK